MSKPPGTISSTATRQIRPPPLSQHLREFASRRDAWVVLARNMIPVVGIYAFGWSAAVAILSVLAIGELIADKLPMIPKRTAPAPLMARVVTGGLCGACLCAAVGKSLLAGTLLGGIGGIVGAFLGYGIRRRLDLHIKDPVVAVCEDVVAVGLALFLVSR